MQGVLILGVHPNSPAAEAGLRGTRQTQGGVIPGDIIQKVGDTPVATSSSSTPPSNTTNPATPSTSKSTVTGTPSTFPLNSGRGSSGPVLPSPHSSDFPCVKRYAALRDATSFEWDTLPMPPIRTSSPSLR